MLWLFVNACFFFFFFSHDSLMLAKLMRIIRSNFNYTIKSSID